jgi:hypothetical protein
MQIRTRSPLPGGIRRCGVRHTAEWQTWPEDQFSAKQMKRLQEDRDVVLEEVKEKAAKEKDCDSGKGSGAKGGEKAGGGK